MTPSIKAEVLQSVAPLGSSLEDDFYMATFRGGKVQKVINVMGGPPRRVRRVLDFDSKSEIEKEEALARKRKELGLASGFEVHTGKKEKTLAEMLLEMRQRKSAGVVATVQRKKLAPKKKVKKAVPVKSVDPVEEVISIYEVAEAVDEEIQVVSPQETTPVEEVVPVDDAVHLEDAVPVEASPPRKKRKRRSTSILHPCSKLLDTEEDSQGDDLTLAEYMKKSASTTGRASSDNAGIKVFQRRKVKFKAVRRRTSKVGDQQSSSILVCDDLCECEVCGPPPPKSAEANAVNLKQPSINETSHPDSCTGEFESLTLPDDLHQLPVRHCSPPIDEADDFQELTEEQFRVEVGQQMPSNTAEVSDLSCPENPCVGRYDKYLDAPNDGPGVPEVLDAESRPQISEEMEGDGGQARCSFNTESSSFCFATSHENAASVVTPMELDLAVDRIESILDTLVTPDDLLPTHLTASASKISRKKKKRRRFSESLSEASLREVSEVENQRQEAELAESTSLAALPENILSSVSEEVASIGSSGIVGQQISEQIAGHISEQICELISHELVSAHEPAVHLLSEGNDTPAGCAVDVEMMVPSSIVNAEECSVNDKNAVPSSDPEEIGRTPTKSSSCDEGSLERDEIVGGTSTSKALFSSLKADSFNKRNRKSFSPKSQKAFLAALKPERSTPSMKIKVMKSKLGERCPSLLFSHEIVDDKSDRTEEVVDDKSDCSEEVVDDKSDSPEEVDADKSGCSEEMVDDKSGCPEEQDPSPDDSFAQDLLQCDVEQPEFYASIDSQPQSPPPQISEEAFISSVLLSTPEPLSDCNTTHIVPGFPEPFVSLQGPDGICTTDHSGIRLLPCTEGSLHIDVECHPETPVSDPKTPNGKIEPASQQPKSILKSAGSETCRGICTCPRCVSTCDQSRTARKFIRSQMVLADVVASKLLDELRNLRTLVEEASPSREGDGTTSSRSQTKGALESASKTEDWAKKEMLKLSRDSKRVCRLIDVGPRRTIFADDAGHRLCHVKLLPAKKTLSIDSLLPSKNL